MGWGFGVPARESAILPAVSRPARKTSSPSIAIVGPGNLGSALALNLARAGYPISLLAVRSAAAKRRAAGVARAAKSRVVQLSSVPLEADVVWLTVPDDAIASLARQLAKSKSWNGKFVFHSSGALTSDELRPLAERGAKIASVHPMMTFVRGSNPAMAGVAFALEGDDPAVRMARSIVRRLGANPITVDKDNKVLYHAFGSFASPLVIALMASLEQVGEAAGIRHRDLKPTMLPLLWQTLRNYLAGDAASAFSGPLVRGDAATVRKHLAQLKKLPEARAVYLALSRAALKTLPVKNRRALKREIG